MQRKKAGSVFGMYAGSPPSVWEAAGSGTGSKNRWSKHAYI